MQASLIGSHVAQSRTQLLAAGARAGRSACDHQIRCSASTAVTEARKKVSLVNLGCSKNTVDVRPSTSTPKYGTQLLFSSGVPQTGCESRCRTMQAEVLLGDLSRSGFEVVEEHEGTDAIVVNTCAFVEDAKAESLQVQLLDSLNYFRNGLLESVVRLCWTCRPSLKRLS